MIPKGKHGHEDGYRVPLYQRMYMLLAVQQVMKIFKKEKYNTLLYIERNGSQLQGIRHKHSHAIGIKQFPESILAKFLALLRQMWPAKLSDSELKKKITHYRENYFLSSID